MRLHIDIAPPAAGSTKASAGRVRLRVRWHHRRIDRELAGGQAPQAAVERALRAAQLCDGRSRRALACGLRNILDAAEEPPRRIDVMPLQRVAIRAAEAELVALACRLAAPKPVSLQGAAFAQVLVCDVAQSPLYNEAAPLSVSEAAQRCTQLLDDLGAGELRRHSP
jgi:hypothetical protein